MKKSRRALKPRYYEPNWHYLDRKQGIWLSLRDAYLWVGCGELFLAAELSSPAPTLSAQTRSKGLLLQPATLQRAYAGAVTSLPKLALQQVRRRYPGFMKPNYIYSEGNRQVFSYRHATSLTLEALPNRLILISDSGYELQPFWQSDPPLPAWLREYTEWFFYNMWLPSNEWQDPRPVLRIAKLLQGKVSAPALSALYKKLVRQLQDDCKGGPVKDTKIVKLAWWLAHPETVASIFEDARANLKYHNYQKLRELTSTNSIAVSSQKDLDLNWFKNSLPMGNPRKKLVYPDSPPLDVLQLEAYLLYNMQN